MIKRVQPPGVFYHHPPEDELLPAGGGGHSQKPLEIELDTLGGVKVKVPYGAQVLKGNGFSGIPRERLTEVERFKGDAPALMRYLTDRIKDGLREEWLGRFERENGRPPESVLVVLSDDSRPKTTPRAAVRAMIELSEELQKDGRAPKKITFITGTGTHKPMFQDEKRPDFAKFFGGGGSEKAIAEGKALWDELKAKAGGLGIQIDPKTGYPVFQHEWDNPDTTVNLRSRILGKPVQVNRAFLEHESIIIAADVDTHPYMGASGGPYKFCIIGIGGKNNFSTHSPDMLSAPTTLPGTFQKNDFFKTVKEAAQGIFEEANPKHGRGRLMMQPVTVNVMMDYYQPGGEVPHDLSVGMPQEWERTSQKIFRAYKGGVRGEKDGVVVAVDNVKGYELIAALRPLANTLAVNSESNRLLSDDVEGRVGVVFNPCHFSDKQVGGIATPATYSHLVVLKAIARAELPKIAEDVRDVQELGQAVKVLRRHRDDVLGRWFRYIEDEFNAAGNLGEGGQRTIRLHRILRDFGQVYVGTTNAIPPENAGKPIPLKGYEKAVEAVYHDPTLRQRLGIQGIPADEAELARDLSFRPVADFLNSLSPPVNELLHPEVQKRLGSTRLTVLGLQAVQMTGDEKDPSGKLVKSHREERDRQGTGVIEAAAGYRKAVAGSETRFLVMPDMHTLADRNA